MTEEEKAEEKAEEYAEEYADWFCGASPSARRAIKQAYLAGLKAGKDMAEADLATIAYMHGAERYKTKWHKVADGDLPEYRYYVLVSRGTRTDKALYNKYEEKWYSYYDGDELDNVTAWCEIPKYKE